MIITRKLSLLSSLLLLACSLFMSSCSKDAKEKEENYVPPPAISGQWRQMFKKVPDAYQIEVGSGRNPNTFSIGSTAYWLKRRQLFAYNPETNSFTPKASFPGEDRDLEVVFSIGGKGYAGLGYMNDTYGHFTYFNDFWEYDPQLDKWTRKADFPLPEFTAPFALAIGQKGYVGSGSARGSLINELYEFDPAKNDWTKKSLPPYYLYTGIAFSAKGKGYFGHIKGTTLYEYDPATNDWNDYSTYEQAPPEGYASVPAASTGYIFLASAMGSNDDTHPSDVYQFQPAGANWKKIPDFPGGGRFYTVTFSIGDKLYMGLGAKTDPNGPLGLGWQKDLWEYTP